MPNYRTYQYRVRGLNPSDHARLDNALFLCAELYNASLQERKQAYRHKNHADSVQIREFDQIKQFTQIRSDLPEWNELHSNVGRGVLRRVDKAFKAFFRRVKLNETPGYPRFRSRFRYQTLEVSEVTPGMLKRSSDGRRAFIKIKGLPVLILRTKRPLPQGKPKTLMITKRPTGYVVNMSFEVEAQPLLKSNSQVGIDMGVNERMTLSDGSTITRRVHDRRRENRLRRKVSRAKKGSCNRRKKTVSLSKETYRNQIRNKNECHQITTDLVKRFGKIAVEDLKIKNMVRNHNFAKSITEQTWGTLTQQLNYKAEYAGRKFVKVNPKHTSKTCSNCGVVLTKKLETYRLFICEACGLVIDRDLNAAKNIEVRGFGSSERRGKESVLNGIASHAQLSSLEPVHAEQ